MESGAPGRQVASRLRAARKLSELTIRGIELAVASVQSD
jgi:hypothetical protein